VNPSSLPAAGRPDDRWRMETGGSGSTKSSSSWVQVVSHYRTPVGVIETHNVSFGSVWGTVSDGLVRSSFVGKFLVEGPLLARHRTKSRRTITSAKPALSCVMAVGPSNTQQPDDPKSPPVAKDCDHLRNPSLTRPKLCSLATTRALSSFA
jgi:hypothetical protein